MNRRWIGRIACGADASRGGGGLITGTERVQRVRRDTPAPADAAGRQPAGRDPALDRAGRRPDPRGSLARAQLVRHVWRDCRDSATRGATVADRISRQPRMPWQIRISPNTTNATAAPIRIARSGSRVPRILPTPIAIASAATMPARRPDPRPERPVVRREGDRREHRLVAELGEEERGPDRDDHRSPASSRRAFVLVALVELVAAERPGGEERGTPGRPRSRSRSSGAPVRPSPRARPSRDGRSPSRS